MKTAGSSSAERRRVDLAHEGVDLPAVGVALDGDVDQAEALLRRVRDLAREHDRAGAGPEHRAARSRRTARIASSQGADSKNFQSVVDSPPGMTRPAASVELLRPPRLEGLEPDLGRASAVRLEVPLEREDGDSIAGDSGAGSGDEASIASSIAARRSPISDPEFFHHHPRVWSRASSGRLAASIPFMPEPSDSSASTSACASRQCVVALTIARARRAGIVRLEDAGADEDRLGAEHHAERGVGRRRDAAGGEVRDRELARLGDLDDELERRLQPLGLAPSARPCS